MTSSIGALRVYLLEYPRRHLQADANRLGMALVLAFPCLSLVLRYRVGISPFYAEDVAAARLALLGLGFCLLPFAAPLVLLALIGGFRRRPDARFWLLCLVSIAALFVNQYGALLLDSLAPTTGEGPDTWLSSGFVRHNAYDLRAIVCYVAAPVLYWLVTPPMHLAPFLD